MNQPYSLRIFVPAGDPDGLRTIEKSNWNGCGIVIPRALLGEARQRKELNRTGVYILVGPAEESGLPRIYIGEGDPIRPRLDSHAAKKDFWTACIAFTSKDEHLNKAHVQYLESRLVALAAQAKRCVLDNGNVPALPSLSEVDAADAEGFLREVLLCCPLLSVQVFTKPPAIDGATRPLFLSGKGIAAQGAETAEGFVVRRDSQAVASTVSSCAPYVNQLREAMIRNGVLAAREGVLVFTQDYVFNSPSTAAGAILGRSSNGREAWKNKDGRMLKELQDG